MIKATVLFSGSEGNCTHITDGKTQILIDAGFNEKRIKSSLQAIGSGLDEIQGIFLTHEHTDHTKALYTLLKNYTIPTYTLVETARALCSKSATPTDALRCIASQIYTVETGSIYEVGTLCVIPFSTPHDVASIGFKIEEPCGNVLCYATDTGCVTKEMLHYFEGCDIAVIEANHDRDMLIDGPYPEFLKQRILSDSGHLSNEIASRFALWLAQNGTKKIILAHLSKENNTPTAVKSVVSERLESNGFNNFDFLIADRYEAVEAKV